MSDQHLHPALDVGDMIDLLRAGVREVNGISNLDDVRLIQACCEAIELDVMWKLTRNGQQAVLVEVPSTADEVAYHRRMMLDPSVSPATSARLAELRSEIES